MVRIAKNLLTVIAKSLLSVSILLVTLTSYCVVPLLAQIPPATNTVIAIGPSAEGIVQAGDGNFYAPSLKAFEACQTNPNQECAFIFKITPGGVMTPFYSFQPISTSTGPTAPNLDGIWPVSLIAGVDGNLYVATRYGGPGGGGTILQIKLDGTYTILKSFGVKTGPEDPGYSPLSMVQGPDGSLYETNGVGVYQLAPDGTFNTIFTFPFDTTAQDFPQGGNATSLMQGDDGNLYLTLSTGPQTAPTTGTNGAIARLNLLNSQLTTIHAFLDDGSEGSRPAGPLVEGNDGNLYGVTSNSATMPLYAFKVNPNPNGAVTLLHKFTGGIDGAKPQSPFFVGSDGNFYGTTLLGGDSVSANCAPTGCGTDFQLTPGGVLTTLHTFEGGTPTSTVVSENPQFDGAAPEAPLVQATDGSFYGTSLFNAIFKTTLNSAPPAPLQMTLKPTAVVAGNPTTVTWKVLNAFSQTAQACGAYIVGNATGAGAWNGRLKGTMSVGVYSGTATITPTAGGTFTYAISCGGNESTQATLVVTNNTDLQLVPPGPVTGTVNQPYQLVLSATGGTIPYQFAFTGTLPKGLTWDPAGAVTGTPLQFGEYPLAFAVQDSSKPPQQDAAAITLTIASGLTLLPVAPNPVVGKYYVQNLVASGGLPPYTWKLASGTLPAGLQLNTANGQIFGTPTEAGKSTFSITISDFEGTPAKVTTSYTLNTAVPPLDITSNALLTDASVGVRYSFTATATGGTSPFFWTILPSAPPASVDPPGIAISQDGILSGTPTQYNLNYYNFYIQVTDSETPPVSAKQYAALKVKPTLTITNTSLPTAIVGSTVLVPLTATGGIPPYIWKGSSIPPPNDIGLYISGDELEESPLVAGIANVTLYVSDSEVNPDSANLSLPLTYLPAPLVTTTTLTSSNSAAGTGETVTLTANVAISGGGAPPGQVIFYNGATSLGIVTLDATGTATLQTSFAASAVYTLTAAYGGNQSYAASTSSPLTETVVTPGIKAAANPASLTIQSGSSGQLTITVTPVGDYSGTLHFLCSDLPAHISCTFTPPTLDIAAGSGPSTVTLTVNTDAPPTALLQNPPAGGTRNSVGIASVFWMPGSLVGLFGLLRRNRKNGKPRQRNLWLIAILFLAGAAALTSCGGQSNAARPGTYTIPVTVTLSGAASQNINATVIVEQP